MKKKEEIISNKIKCKKYGDIIESKSTNDYKKCFCGAVVVDGGKDYLKRTGYIESDYFWHNMSNNMFIKIFVKRINNLFTFFIAYIFISTFSNHTILPIPCINHLKLKIS